MKARRTPEPRIPNPEPRLLLFVPDDPAERFPVAGRIIPVAPVDTTAPGTEKQGMVTAHADAHGVVVDFETLLVPEGGDRLLADLTVTLTGSGWVAAVGYALPLAVGPDLHQRRTTVGGQTRDEVWRLDQNDEDSSEEWARKVSDTRARWPLWRVGGLLVDAPHHYLIWKASDRTTPPLPMDQGEGCPGWVEYSDATGEVRVAWAQMQNSPPAGITVDGEQGVLWLWLHPPAIRPLRVAGIVTRTARIVLDAHANL